jgi:hypothetical protein
VLLSFGAPALPTRAVRSYKYASFNLTAPTVEARAVRDAWCCRSESKLIAAEPSCCGNRADENGGETENGEFHDRLVRDLR